MAKSKDHVQTGFLAGSGEIGALIQSMDWSDHSLGPCDDWPASLRITLDLMLNSPFPMALFWESEFLCFYNDAFHASLDRDSSPSETIGNKGKNIWPNRWQMIKSQVDRVRQEGEAIRCKDPLLHNSHESPIWTCGYSPVKNQAGKVAGVLAICKEEHPNGVEKQTLNKNDDKKNNLLEGITDGFYELDKNWIVINWNEGAERLLDIKREEILGENIWDAFPEGKGLKFYPAYKKVKIQRVRVSFEEYYEPWGRWFSFKAYPSNEGIFVYFKDITKQRRLRLINERTEEISGVAGWEYDVASQQVFLTPKGYDIYGLSREKSIDLETNKQLFDKQSLAKIEESLERAIEHKESYEIELNLTRPDGEKRFIEIHGFPQEEHGKVTKLYGTIKDVTLRKKQQEELKKANEKLKKAQHIAQMGYWTHELVEDVGDWSEEVYKIWELDPEEFVPTYENLLGTIHPDDIDRVARPPEEAFPEENFYDTEHRIITPDGKVKWIFQRITLHRDEEGNPQWLEGVAQDITEKKEREQEIRKALKEKETLLAEIHHRVKNNLAVVSGMMQLQAFEEEDEALKVKLMDSVTRIVSMATIHEQLYRSNSFSDLNFSESLNTLIQKIVEAMQTQTEIALDFNLEPLQLNVNQAIPLSLIVNEVTTNVLKHAFKGKEKGEIVYKLAEEDQEITLSVSDNGVGLPDDFDIDESSTLGHRLIDILATQLEADYSYESTGNGTSFSIQFDKSEIKGVGNTEL